ncbi:MAG: hypothetical protein PUP92_36705, partial [Rhizonema sp. PD38]|nr:hypothetical protein [Rhizonema sp. PD38]
SLTFSSLLENRSGAINPRSDELTCSRFMVNVPIPPKRATPPLGQAQYRNYLITCPTNIPALTAVDLGQKQCGLSICFLDIAIYVSHDHHQRL